jgi:N-acetylglucosamine-6-phosphate deacetylase
MSKNHPEIVLSIGHSNATYEESIKSFKCGISHATHMFNAMPSYHHREVGVIGAVLDDDSVSCDVIADTIHTHHTTLSLLYRQKKSNLMLITDSMRAGCIKDGVYDLGGQAVYVKDGKATLPSGVLAGSVLKLNQAVSNMLKYSNASIQEVIAMVTELPAKKLGINKGLLEIGYDTDIVIFDTDIDIKLSIISGKVAYKKE